MGVIDIIIVCCFLPAIFFGLKNGFIKQLMAVLIVFLGIRLALKWADPVSARILSKVEMSDFWVKVVAFVAIFTAVAMVLNLASKLLDKVVKVTLLEWLNRILGILAALAVFAFIISVIVYLTDSLNGLIHFIPGEKIAESKMYTPLLELAKSVFPHLKELF